MQSSTKSNFVPIVILGVFFFIFGFVTWLNATLIPYLKIACELTTSQAYLVTFAFYISYFVTALPSAAILKKTGLKNGMMLGLLVMAVGALVFIPAAQSRTYGLFLTGLFIIGTGLSILQTASNPYVTILGPIESAAKRISIMGICNKIAGILAPLILGALILSDSDQFKESLKVMDAAQKALALDGLSSRVILPYVVMAIVLAGLGALVRFSPLPEIEQEEDETANTSNLAAKRKSVWGFPNLALGVATLFFYVGAEVIAVDTIYLYGESQGFLGSVAKKFPSYTLMVMVVGYFIGILVIPKIISQAKALTMSAVLGLVLTILAVSVSGENSVWFIIALGLANALVWPAIWPLAIHGLGDLTKTGAAYLIMAIAGGALLPLLYGRLAEMKSVGDQQAYWMLVPCYLIILYYALKGHKKTSW